MYVCEEFVYCGEGEVECLVNEEWHRLEAGDSLLFQSPQPHLCRNISLNEAIVLFIILAAEEYVRLTQHSHLFSDSSRNQVTITEVKSDRLPAAATE